MRTIKRHPVLRTLFLASAFLLAGALSISPGRAAADFGVRGGLYPDEEEPFLGAEALFDVGAAQRWYGNPNLEHAFVDSGDLTTFSFDFHYDVHQGPNHTVWAGAGPTLIHRDRNNPGDDDSTDAGVNLLVGVGARKGDVRPYGQFKIVLADDSQAVMGVGVRDRKSVV